MRRYLADERFQLALSVGLGMNIMGGDQFRQQQGAGAGATAGAAATGDDGAPSSTSAAEQPAAAPSTPAGQPSKAPQVGPFFSRPHSGVLYFREWSLEFTVSDMLLTMLCGMV